MNKVISEEAFDLTSAYEKFLQFEDKFDLFEKKINGVYFWERIRFNAGRLVLYPQLFQLKETEKSSLFSKFKAKSKKILKYLKSILYVHRNPVFSKVHDVLFLSHPRRKKKEDGKWWDIYTDHYLPLEDYSSLSIETHFSNTFLTPAKTKNLKYFTFYNTLINIKRLWKKTEINFSEEEINLLQNMSKKYYELFDVDINFVKLVRLILIRRERILPKYIKFLKKINPKVVLVVVSYSHSNFIEACKILDIPTVELQHGIISRYHLGYSFEGEKAKKETFPDYLFTFGKYWNECVEYPISKENIVAIGFPEFEEQKEKYKHLSKKKQILFISQPIEDNNKLSRIALKLSKSKNIEYKIIFKLHPSEDDVWKEWYPWLNNSPVEIVDRSGDDLYKLFATSEFIVGMHSTAIYEGLGFGVKTFLLDCKVTPYITDLIDTKAVKMISSADDIINNIGTMESQKIEKEYFFKRNSKKNMLRELKKVIEG